MNSKVVGDWAVGHGAGWELGISSYHLTSGKSRRALNAWLERSKNENGVPAAELRIRGTVWESGQGGPGSKNPGQSLNQKGNRQNHIKSMKIGY